MLDKSLTLKGDSHAPATVIGKGVSALPTGTLRAGKAAKLEAKVTEKRPGTGPTNRDQMPKKAVLTTVTLKKSGGSLIMTVPAAARKLLSLSEGQKMGISVEGNRVIMEAVLPTASLRVRRPKYALDELLAVVEPADAPSNEDRVWQDAPPAGRETW